MSDERPDGEPITLVLKEGQVALTPAPPVELPPAFRARYRLERQVGVGAMGAVWLAHDVANARAVAIKFLNVVRDAETEERFRREGRLLSAIHHPNVLAVHEAGEVDGHFYLVTEYLGRGNLRARMLPAGVPLATAMPWIAGVLAGLDACHRQSVLHRDLKPENVMFGDDERPRLCDFGISARTLEVGELTASGQIMGTPRYMAPELIEVAANSTAVDIYAMGIIIYELLAGRAPFDDRHIALAFRAHREVVPEPLDRVARVPPEVARVIARALAKNPDDRQASPGALAAELAEAMRGPGPPASRPSRRALVRAPVVEVPRPPARAWWRWAALLAPLAMLTFAWRDPGRAEPEDAFLARAAALSAAGRWPEAQVEMRACLRAWPASARAWDELLALWARSSGDPAAVQALTDKVARDPDAFSLGALALLHADEKHADQARALATRAVAADPRDFCTHEVRGVVAYKAGQLDLAHVALARACALDRYDPYPFYWMARVALDLGRPAEAEEYATRGLSMPHRLFDLVRLREAAQRARGHAAAAARDLVERFEADPADTELGWFAAECLAALGQISEVVRLAASLSPGQQKQIPGLIAAWSSLRHDATALCRTWLGTARQLDPEGPITRAAAILIFVEDRPKHTQATLEAAELRKLAPDAWLSHIAFAKLDLLHQQLSDARRELDAALALPVWREFPHELIGDMLFLEPSRAFVQYDRALAMEPGNLPLRIHVARTHLRLVQPALGIALLDRLPPEERTMQFHLALGQLYDAAGDGEHALPELMAALQMGADDLSAAWRVVKFLEDKGRWQEAKTYEALGLRFSSEVTGGRSYGPAPYFLLKATQR